MLGNVLFELFLAMGGDILKPEPVMGELMILIRTASKQLKNKAPPINTLTFPMIRAKGKAPKLKTKAAEGRHMLPIVKLILESFVSPVDRP